MNRDLISRLAHADHPIASPLDDASVSRLLDRALGSGAKRVLDLGCGGGEWLLRALVSRADVSAVGVDRSEVALAHAEKAARELGVADRLVLHCGDVEDFPARGDFDVVLCVGSVFAFGGLLAALASARKHIAPGGAVLIGEGFWSAEPSAEAAEMLGEFSDLAGTVDTVVRDGWTPIYGHISTRNELDAYEWAWTGALAAWALDNPDAADSTEALEVANTHRSEWLTVYRDSWGFVCMVLRSTGD